MCGNIQLKRYVGIRAFYFCVALWYKTHFSMNLCRLQWTTRTQHSSLSIANRVHLHLQPISITSVASATDDDKEHVDDIHVQMKSGKDVTVNAKLPCSFGSAQNQLRVVDYVHGKDKSKERSDPDAPEPIKPSIIPSRWSIISSIRSIIPSKCSIILTLFSIIPYILVNNFI